MFAFLSLSPPRQQQMMTMNLPWPSMLVSGWSPKTSDQIAGKVALELGSEWGISYVVCRDLYGAAGILDTNFREEYAADPNLGQRLVPDNVFGVNLYHNVGEDNVLNIDWNN